MLEKKEEYLNEKLERVEMKMDRFARTSKGDPERIMNSLVKLMADFDRHAFEHDTMESMRGWAQLEHAVNQANGV